MTATIFNLRETLDLGSGDTLRALRPIYEGAILDLCPIGGERYGSLTLAAIPRPWSRIST